MGSPSNWKDCCFMEFGLQTNQFFISCFRDESIDKMVSGSDNLQLDSVDNELSKHRSVCDSSQQQVATLCVSYPRRESSGDRCNVNELERNAHLCVSSVCSDFSDNQQDLPTSLQHSVDSTSLGWNVLVSRHSSVNSSTGHSDSLAQKSVDTIGPEICLGKRRKLKTSRLEFIRRSIRDRMFSAKVARQAAEARRSSTRRVYDAKWKVFSDRCMQREAHPFSATPSEVADILLHLFQEKKCQVSTIKDYRSTNSNTCTCTLKFKSDNNIGSDPIISELIIWITEASSKVFSSKMGPFLCPFFIMFWTIWTIA